MHTLNPNISIQTLDPRNKPELTCISEEGIADMDLPDHLLEELDYLGDCITSCDKVENYLMRSEYENNLIIKPGENLSSLLSEKRFSRLKRTLSVRANNAAGALPSNGGEAAARGGDESAATAGASSLPSEPPPSLPPELNNYNKFAPRRHITVIEEASV